MPSAGIWTSQSPGLQLLLFLQSLLLMRLLHLLLSCFAGILLSQPLMFLILLPLQFLAVLLLLRKHSLLLLLVFTIAIRVAELAAAGRSNGGMPSGFLFPESRRMSGGQRYSPKVDGCGCITTN
jgi:hypothetical protein